MNRRNFFKAVTGFVAGVFAGTAKSSEKDLCGGQNGTLCPRCKFNYPSAMTLGTSSNNVSCIVEIKHWDIDESGDREKENNVGL